LQDLHLPRHLRTLRSVLQARLAPDIERELASQTPFLATLCKGNDNNAALDSRERLRH
jgi:transformation/transcription domain-associated protein